MSITASKCLFFDETSSLWTDRGCEVGSQTTDEQLHCICDHLTAFAGFVAPNPLDLGSTFTFDLDRSLIALVTVCVVMALYIVAVFIGRSLDLDDERRLKKGAYRRQRKREYRVHQQREYKNVPQTTTGKRFLSEHLWISVVNPPSNHFTRVQRISCCLSLLMSFMLVNIMFYRGDRNFVPRVTGGRVQLEQLFSWDTFIIGLESSLIALPINVIVVVLYRYAGPRHDTSSSANGSHPKGKNNYVTPQKGRPVDLPRYLPRGNGTGYTADPTAHIHKLKKQGALKKSEAKYDIEKHGSKVAVSEKPYRPLPWWSVIVAWFLVAAIVIVSGAFTVLYGNDYGRAKSQAWLLAFLISFLTDFILLQPVKIILVIIFFKLVTKKTKPSPETVSNIQRRVDNMIETEWERRRRYLLQMDHDRRLRRPANGPAYVNTASNVNTAPHVNTAPYHPPPRPTYINTSNPPYVNVKDSKQHNNMRQYQSLVPRRR